MKIQQIMPNIGLAKQPAFKGFYGKLTSQWIPADGCSGGTVFTLSDPDTNYPMNSRTLYDGFIFNREKIESLKAFSGHYDPNCYVEYVKPSVDEFGAELNEELIYFADPEEGITTDVKARANYIVHDPEPSYPHIDKEVAKAYFEGSYEDYSQHYDTVARYFKRLEKADKKTLGEWMEKPLTDDTRQKIEYYTGRLANSSKQQKNATECRVIYEKSDKLRKELRELCYEERQLLDRLRRNSYHTTEVGKAAKAEYDAKYPQIQEQMQKLRSQLQPYFEELKKLYVDRGIKVIKHI